MPPKLTIYSRDNKWRAVLSDTPEGVNVKFFSRLCGERRGGDASQLDPAELSKYRWKLTERDVIDRPFHVVCNHTQRILDEMSNGKA